MKMWSVDSPTPEHLTAIGMSLGRLRPMGHCVALLGELGAGKTTLSQGIGAGLGLATAVTSPTFGLMVEHAGPCPLLHIDAYRLKSGEAEGIGLEETLEDWPGLAVVEWADLVVNALPEDCVFAKIHHAEAGRTLQVWATRPRGLGLLRRWYGVLP